MIPNGRWTRRWPLPWRRLKRLNYFLTIPCQRESMSVPTFFGSVNPRPTRKRTPSVSAAMFHSMPQRAISIWSELSSPEGIRWSLMPGATCPCAQPSPRQPLAARIIAWVWTWAEVMASMRHSVQPALAYGRRSRGRIWSATKTRRPMRTPPLGRRISTSKPVRTWA